MNDQDWEGELRGIGRIVGVTDPDASAEAIGDAITSERETLRNALRYLANQVRHLNDHVSSAALTALNMEQVP